MSSYRPEEGTSLGKPHSRQRTRRSDAVTSAKEICWIAVPTLDVVRANNVAAKDPTSQPGAWILRRFEEEGGWNNKALEKEDRGIAQHKQGQHKIREVMDGQQTDGQQKNVEDVQDHEMEDQHVIQQSDGGKGDEDHQQEDALPKGVQDHIPAKGEDLPDLAAWW
ncbi:hypothetical protein PRZ48_008854 [Zasmidium cellare]|uniref:Uncharacterized protein n=1 Tax=Zasmidium cellare TaxID=395010 RepID=A0ABR0EHB6_ZASCE|nr:hypothetical protein PRZ48_008854 [Zasmidium cellare]